MNATARRLAQSVSSLPLEPVSTAAAQLLPPVVLYRRLLRAHRQLPIEMRSLGDDYVKSEFKRTRKVDNPLQLVGFLGQWKLYLDDLEKSQGLTNVGRRLEQGTLEKLSPEQLGQLYELMQATRSIYGPGMENSQEAPEAGVGSQGGKSEG